MILHEIFRVVSSCPRYISCYIVENRFPLRQYCILLRPLVVLSLFFPCNEIGFGSE